MLSWEELDESLLLLRLLFLALVLPVEGELLLSWEELVEKVEVDESLLLLRLLFLALVPPVEDDPLLSWELVEE